MIEKNSRVQSKLKNELGEVVFEALKNPDVLEIMLNPDGKLWIETFDGMKKEATISPENAKNVINTISSFAGQITNKDNPSIGGDVKIEIDGKMELFRFQGEIPPVVANPSYTIRKPASRVFSLDQYLEKKIITKTQYLAIKDAIKAKKSILVVGGTGSGKTTFCNALIDEIAKQEPNSRMITIEDTEELRCNIKNKLALFTCKARTMDDLLYSALRHRPDRLVVGEVRGKEAYTVLKAWNTGHPGGVCTIHANSALDALSRLEQLIHEANVCPDETAIASAVNILIFIEKINGDPKRQVKEIIELQGFNKKTKEYIYEQIC